LFPVVKVNTIEDYSSLLLDLKLLKLQKTLSH
jgi:hypothetical protein